MIALLLGRWKLFATISAVITVFFFAWTFRGYIIENAALKQTLALSQKAAEKSNALTNDENMIRSGSNLRDVYEEVRKPEYDCIVPTDGLRILAAEKANRPN